MSEEVLKKRSEIDFEFEPIGRAMDSDYYFYREAVIVCDPMKYVFQTFNGEKWSSLGSNGYKVFKEALDEKLLIKIDMNS